MNPFDLVFLPFYKGGPIMLPILGVSVVVWVIGFYRLMVLRSYACAYKELIKHLDLNGKKAEGRGEKEKVGMQPTGIDAFDRLGKRLKENVPATDYAYRSFLLEIVPELQSGLDSMKSWIAAAPLLGLLGTVSGMMKTFRIITQYGIGNPHLMAEGISVALLTTQAGLIVAFPGMLLHNFVLGRKNALVNKLLRDGEFLCGNAGMKTPGINPGANTEMNMREKDNV